ncbi:DUF4189 domain-containing protein [Luteibacter aegosomaticola]|uniref:DUF4189 domain-containing protein n=1 Tax=Luteibacter aegosomaticola TaxID=2911538 RepID=UPI001FF73B7B|nr:DUF4189 domain-containing protein [Luteibacter aegosomaticola]UPG91587.1 DUF4189 domain-containing protein [Luteibacter aegosomaticola]
MKYTISLLALAFSGALAAQCAPGVPSAGNPGCIPPNQQNSPYYQGQPAEPTNNYYGRQSTVAWTNGWAALAVDRDNGATGSAVKIKSGPAAKRAAKDECKRNGGTNCKIAIHFANECAAAAQPLDGGSLSTATAKTEDEARAEALGKCGDANSCKVLVSACSAFIRDE